MTAARFGAVLFDLDGTLLDTAPDFSTAINRLLADKGQPPMPADRVRKAVTNGSAGLITVAFGLAPGEPGFDDIREQLLAYYRECIADRTRPFPGMEDILRRLADSGTPWGIVTNKPELYTSLLLSRLPLPSAPAAVVCPDHVNHTKPDPEPILLACKQLDADPRQCIYIGDHLRDIQAGLSAGSTTVAARYGYIDDSEDPAGWGAHYLIDSAPALAGILFTGAI